MHQMLSPAVSVLCLLIAAQQLGYRRKGYFTVARRKLRPRVVWVTGSITGLEVADSVLETRLSDLGASNNKPFSLQVCLPVSLFD